MPLRGVEMRILHVLLVVIPLSLPGAALAQRSPVVVELFTSQGCTSCPPADALLGELADRPDVLPLALHVTIWDYLGWKDKFGLEANTRRQYAYAKAARKRSIYTPQMIVEGVDRAVGSDAERVLELVDEHARIPPAAELDIERRGEVLNIRLAPVGPAGSGPADVYLVRFMDNETVAIEYGENAGQEIEYHNIVTDWTALARWDGRTEAEFGVELAGDANVAVIVQQERFGPVLTAARLP